MRVLFLLDSLGTGGAERSTLDFCYYLRSIGCGVRIICLRKRDEGIETEALSTGIEIFFVTKKGLLNQIGEIDTLSQQFRPDVVHSTLYKSRLRGKLQKILYFRKHILVESLVTLPFTNEKIKHRERSSIRSWAHRVLETFLGLISVNHYIAISKEVKHHFITHHTAISADQVSVIYRGRGANIYRGDKEKLRELYSQELCYAKDAIVFVHVGRQDLPKNHFFLLKAFFRLMETTRSTKEIVLLCLGRRGEMSVDIDSLMRNAVHSSRVRFLGHRLDVPQILAQSDIFIFPSLFEGLGGSIIEAKAAQLAIIVSNLDVFRELLEEDTEAYFASLSDVNDFASKMEFLVAHPEIRREMGLHNKHSYLRRFSSEQIHEQMHELYLKLLNEGISTGNKSAV